MWNWKKNRKVNRDTYKRESNRQIPGEREGKQSINSHFAHKHFPPAEQIVRKAIINTNKNMTYKNECGTTYDSSESGTPIEAYPIYIKYTHCLNHAF